MIIVSHMKRVRKSRLFAAIHRRLRELDMTQSELAEQIGMSDAALSSRMTGFTPWTEPEMQRVLDEIGQPEETLADLFPRRKVSK